MTQGNSTDDVVTVDLEIDSLYTENKKEISSFRRRLGHKHYVNLIKRYGSKTNNMALLDVGTGSGSFLHYVNNQSVFGELCGIEYDYRLVEQCNRNVEDGICVQGNAEKFCLNRRFDVITSFQVIEHLFDPDCFFKTVRNHLSENGILLLTTPNLDSTARRLLNGAWHGFRSDHVNLYQFDRLPHEAKLHGFETIYQGSTFFSGIPILNKLPMGILNWSLLYTFGSLPWKYGEAIVGVYKID